MAPAEFSGGGGGGRECIYPWEYLAASHTRLLCVSVILPWLGGYTIVFLFISFAVRLSIINSFLIYLSICLLIYHPIYDLSLHSSSLVDLSIHSLLFTSVCEEVRPIFEMGLSL